MEDAKIGEDTEIFKLPICFNSKVKILKNDIFRRLLNENKNND